MAVRGLPGGRERYQRAALAAVGEVDLAGLPAPEAAQQGGLQPQWTPAPDAAPLCPSAVGVGAPAGSSVDVAPLDRDFFSAAAFRVPCPVAGTAVGSHGRRVPAQGWQRPRQERRRCWGSATAKPDCEKRSVFCQVGKATARSCPGPVSRVWEETAPYSVSKGGGLCDLGRCAGPTVPPCPSRPPLTRLGERGTLRAAAGPPSGHPRPWRAMRPYAAHSRCCTGRRTGGGTGTIPGLVPAGTGPQPRVG